MHLVPPESAPRRPRLTPAIADVRRAVRAALSGEPAAELPTSVGAATGTPTEMGGTSPTDGPLVLVALSGGADSLALAAATAFEAPRAGVRAGAVIVDHGLQEGSADVAARAARRASELGLHPVQISRVIVGTQGGPEAAARDARYDALTVAAVEHGATAVLLGHTLDDQAETVLLGLARGSGATSLQGMAASVAVPVPSASADDWRIEFSDRPIDRATRAPGAGERELLFLRPLLGIRRVTTAQFCDDSGLPYWTDPHNSDPAYTRVRVRERVLPLLEAELGPGVAEALVRTAEQLREDAAALDHFADEVAEELAEVAEAGISLPVGALAANPPALRHRLIRLAVQSEFHLSLSRAHTLEVARLVTDWHGQGPLDLPGIRVERADGLIVFTAAHATG